MQEIERLLQSSGGDDAALREALVKVLASRERTADTLWVLVIAGLLALAGLALAGLLYLVADGNPATQPDLALTAFVGVLCGLLGLLIGAPWREPAE